MRVPRFGIGSIMVFVVIVALDFAALRASYLRHGPWSNETRNMIEMLVRGGLPMANILAIGFLIGLRRDGSHPSLLGFEVFGGAALVLFGLIVIVGYRTWTIDYNVRYHHFVPQIIAKHPIPRQIAASFTLVSPQLACALLGGFLSANSDGPVVNRRRRR